MSGFPTSVLAIIGTLITALIAVGTFAGKLITDLRSDNKALQSDLKATQDKIMDRVLPTLEATTAAATSMVNATTKLIEAGAVVEDRRRRP